MPGVFRFSMTTETPVSAADIRRAAMNLLARRDYSRAELVSRLQRRFGIGSPVDAVVAQLSSEGLQDDKRFAESFVRYRRQQGKGPRRIQQDLQARGISCVKSCKEGAVEGEIQIQLDTNDDSWLEQARQVHERRFGAEAPKDANEYGKRLRFLLYRGYDNATARKVIPAIRHRAVDDLSD
jgi:regulatory protein